MTYEEVWQKIKGMSQRDRSLLAYEMTLKGFDIGYIHPHYYFDAKAVHDILFYPSDSQHEIEDKDGTYYNALKRLLRTTMRYMCVSNDMFGYHVLSMIGVKQNREGLHLLTY